LTDLVVAGGTVVTAEGSFAADVAITDRQWHAARRDIEARDGAGASARFEVIMPVRQSVLGLMRYIEKTIAG